MSLKIIKQGVSPTASIERFRFSENLGASFQKEDAVPGMDLPVIPEASAALRAPSAPLASPTPNPVPAPALEEPPKPAVDLAELERTAYENGFKHGEKAGMEIAEQKIEVVMRRYAEAILEVNGLRETLFARAEREVVRLALEVAKKIVHREIRIDNDIVQTLVRVALSHVSEKSAMTVYLNPLDYNYLLERRTELAQNGGRDLELVSDRSVERGGCLVKTECGDVDARIEEKFREVENAFFEGMK